MAFLCRVLRKEIRPAMAIERLPLVIPASASALEPARTINAFCHQWEQQPGMLDCVFFHGFSHTDVPDAGVSVVAVAENDAATARRAVRAVAREIWARREAFQMKFAPPAEAVAQAGRLAGAARPS
jgi:microcystin degradation protein MlrC